jgi:natural product biosynthesis luciferase-like monooxygenase protein
MDFSIMFWGDVEHGVDPKDKYRLLFDVARYADANGYAALWVPERHFHPWGGLFPNPAVVCSALAAVTNQIRLRAGSVVVPLHHPVRIAEDWSVVDNISGGRVEIAAATGWKADDFVIAPQRYEKRKTEVWDTLDSVRALWRGGKYAGENGKGVAVQVPIFPQPIQPELPVWVTSFGSMRTITGAGGSGFNLLTHLLGQEFDDVEKKVEQYNAYRARGEFAEPGKVALMLHTFLGDDVNRVKAIVREPFSSYLRQSADLMIPPEQRARWDAEDPALVAELVDLAFDRYFDTASLMGTVESCRPTVERVANIGVTEICCLVDFGVAPDQVMESLEHLTRLKNSVAS